jgi:serine/threonine-protein kinase
VQHRICLESGAEPFPGFRLRQLRGRGGFAEVWEAENASGTRIALKFIQSQNTASTVREIKAVQAIQRLSHAHLVFIERVWSAPGYIVIAMELAEGSLLELLEAYHAEYRTPVEPRLLCRYLRQAASALDFMNTRQHQLDGRQIGFQHCDIKPSNILLIGDNAKLADFGLSTPTTAMLNPYQRGGTLDFAAPEIHRGTLAETSDQYSLAVTYYYLRTGRFPFPEVSDFRRKHSYERPAPDLNLVPWLERKVLERGLDLQPEKRWPSSVILIQELAETHNQKGSSSIMVRPLKKQPESA